jgi:tetratricopeptide (TPR) repeat protein
MKLKPTQGLFKFDFKDSHAFLGVPIDADTTGIRDRYKEIARLMHPDSARWKNSTDKELATKIFSSLITHAYSQLSRAAQLQEQQMMLDLLGRRILTETNKVDLAGEAAQKLYKESTAAINNTYQKLLRELADRQYQNLGESMDVTGQISELNLVYLLRRQNQSIGPQPSGGRVASNSEPLSNNPAPETTTPNSSEVAKVTETANLPRVENALRRAEEYIGMRNWAKASIELREVLKEDGNNVKAHAQIAIVYFRQNQSTMAKVHMKKALQLDPNDPTVKVAGIELKNLMTDSAKPSKAKAATDAKGGLFGMFGGKK